jgi:hypothetical protein
MCSCYFALLFLSQSFKDLDFRDFRSPARIVPPQFYAEKVCNPFLVKAGLVRDRLHLPIWAGKADAPAIRGTWGPEVRLGISFDLLFVSQGSEGRHLRKFEIRAATCGRHSNGAQCQP